MPLKSTVEWHSPVNSLTEHSHFPTSSPRSEGTVSPEYVTTTFRHLLPLTTAMWHLTEAMT
ncbi:hypothetical protein [uncultured Duncaniella sp.]|uniref:hypothetical protein n=1 Tax=uncultured Duncaniella sp. TaxID=2768039 RepID=UPI00266EE8D3|nr:hypothetical protein [uncultured Duncaniella sp.]